MDRVAGAHGMPTWKTPTGTQPPKEPELAVELQLRHQLELDHSVARGATAQKRKTAARRN